MEHFYMTHCCKDKSTEEGLLPVLKRYLAKYILYVYQLSKMENTKFLIFSGKYGLLQEDNKIPYYDKLLDYSDFEHLNPIVDEQYKKNPFNQLTFFHIDTKLDEKVAVYVEFITEFAKRNNISLKCVPLNPSKLILPKTIEKKLLKKEISKIKKEKRIFVVSHFSQKMDIKEISDFVGGVYDIIRIVNKYDYKTILVCGVSFIAELVSIFNPKKIILQPREDAICRYEDDLDEIDLDDLKKIYQESVILSHISSNIKVKCKSDYICDTAHLKNIGHIINSNQIIFLGGSNLGEYLANLTKKEIIYNEGKCIAASKVTSVELESFLKTNKIDGSIKILVSPHCHYSAFKYADEILSNTEMYNYVKNSKEKNFLVCAEINLFEQLKKHFPDKMFYQPLGNLICNDMHRTKLINVYNSLADLKYIVKIPDELSEIIRPKVYGLNL